jgi:aminoglycoside N3'-acetyltransferase
VITRAEIETGLRDLGLTKGMAVEVHSSLSSFGDVEGGAESVITALMTVVGPGGALVMPAFPFSPLLPLTEADRARGIRSKVRVLDPTSPERTGMGIIADTFRQRDDVVTGPGFFRVSAWGREAEAHSWGFQRLLDSGGWALLLGVDIHRLSTMHYAENRMGGVPAEITSYFAAGEDVQADYPREQWYVEVGSTPEDGWAKIQSEAFRRGLVRQRRIGTANCMFFPAAEVTGLYEIALRTDPYGLFGVRPPSAIKSFAKRTFR